jgi:hypothetical protein
MPRAKLVFATHNRRPIMLSRYLVAGTVSIVVLAGVQYYQNTDAPAPNMVQVRVDQVPGAPEEQSRTWREFDERAQRRDGFARYDAHLLQELMLKRTTLRDATERIFYYCLQHYPEHLENVHHAEQAQHIKMKLARNLLRGLQVRQETQGGDPAVVASLECELRVLPYEPDGAAELTAQ